MKKSEEFRRIQKKNLVIPVPLQSKGKKTPIRFTSEQVALLDDIVKNSNGLFKSRNELIRCVALFGSLSIKKIHDERVYGKVRKDIDEGARQTLDYPAHEITIKTLKKYLKRMNSKASINEVFQSVTEEDLREFIKI